MEGLLSYMKGCTLFSVSESTSGSALLYQESQNPNVYTKLSCFLPWIAEQYRMSYDSIGSEDECTNGVGDKSEVKEAGECRTQAAYKVNEALCIFPFYWNGKRYDGCIMLDEDEFILPVFRCPIYNTVNKIDGINSFTWEDDYVQQVTLTILHAESFNKAGFSQFFNLFSLFLDAQEYHNKLASTLNDKKS